MAIELNGDADYLWDSSPDSSLQIIGSMSAFGWFYFDSYPASNFAALIGTVVTGEDEADNITYELYIDTDGKLHVFWEYDSGDNVDTGAVGAAVGTGEWMCLGFTRTTGADSSVTIYKNAASLGSVSSLTNATGGSNTDYYVGGHDVPASRVINGKITEVAVWNTVLDAGEITTLAGADIKGIPLTIQSSNLMAYHPLDDYKSGSAINTKTFRDLSGVGNTVVGVDADGDSSVIEETALSYSRKLELLGVG